ncbi:UNVERIFIED_CONTAM: hypothetical protein Sradi_0693000 [Sesamum radiatum]|uniref:Uncharacterized protein n=1 Tax=Sesamum radiatum TaxID=300843 RepID=A0AAW2VPH3_SESRA
MDKAPSSQVAGCEHAECQLAGSRARRSRAHQPGDSWKAEIAGFFGRESLTCKNSFWKGSCKSLLIWNEDSIAL